MKTIHLTLSMDCSTRYPFIAASILVRHNTEQSFKNISRIGIFLQQKLLKSKTCELYFDVSLCGTFLSNYELKTVKRILQQKGG
jgi:hypothetical protein